METTTKKVLEAISNITEDIGSIAKSRTNQHQNYKFRGIDDVYLALQPLLIKHRIVILPNFLSHKKSEFLSAKGTLTFHHVLEVNYTIQSVEDGSSISLNFMGEAMDTGDKGIPKALSVAYKYLVFQLFCIPTTSSDDVENETHEVKHVAPQSTQPADDKKWLNVTNQDGVTITKEYANILDAIAKNTITSIEQVTAVYKMRAEVKQQLIKDLKNGQ